MAAQHREDTSDTLLDEMDKEMQAKQATFEAQLRAEYSAKQKVTSIVPTPHGGLFALKEDGSIWERYADPAPRQTPGPAGFLWRKIEGP